MGDNDNAPRCRTTGKVRYANKRLADEALGRAIQRGQQVERHYSCTACRGWHLTSKPMWWEDK